MPYTEYTRAALRQMLQERWESTPFWTEADANLALNQSLRVWNLLTSYWRERIVVDNIADTPLIAVPGTLAQQTAVTWKGLPMTGVAVSELQYLAANWWFARAGVDSAPERPLFWAPVGLTLIAIYPAVLTVDSFEIDGVRRTPVLVSDTATVNIGSEELDILLGYATHVAALKTGTRLLERTTPGLTAFLRAAGTRNPLLQQSAWYANFQKTEYAWNTRPEVPAVGSPTATIAAGADGTPV